MRDRRRATRRNTPHRLNVVAADSDAILGRLVDITPGGLMVVAPRTWLEGERLHVRIPLPTVINGRTELELEIEAVWQSPDDNPRYHRSGFRFVAIGGEDAYIIETVMHRLHLVG